MSRVKIETESERKREREEKKETQFQIPNASSTKILNKPIGSNNYLKKEITPESTCMNKNFRLKYRYRKPAYADYWLETKCQKTNGMEKLYSLLSIKSNYPRKEAPTMEIQFIGVVA